MNTLKCIAIVCTIGLLSATSLADRIIMKNGSVREGVIVDQSPTEIRVRIDDGGLVATVTIDMNDVSRIDKGPVKPAAPTTPPAAPTTVTTKPASAPVTVSDIPLATSRPTSRPTPTGSLPPPRGFLIELAASMVGNGPGNLSRLPKDLQDLWSDASALDKAGNKKAAELESLRKLEEGFRNVNGLERLDGLSIKERTQPFGLWMASIHFDALADNYKTGSFDLNDVRDVEKAPLIGIMKEKTTTALEPLKAYFPPVNDKTGKQEQFNRSQLSGITVDNALDVKDKAELAHALIAGQIKLEPQMPPADHQLLYAQLTNVNHVLSRCAELESAARLKADRAKNQK
jgi:hypothetical protein